MPAQIQTMMMLSEGNCKEAGAHQRRGKGFREGREVGLLNLASYNCRGFSSSEDEIRHLYRGCDILAVQEHWLMPCEFGRFNSIDDDVIFSSVSPMEVDVLRQGRPFGGVALLWHRDMQKWIVPVETGTDRLAAVMLQLGSRRVLLVGVYMPVDYGNQQSMYDFTEQLGYLEGLISSVDFDSFIRIGDFNADLDKRSRFACALCTFMNENGLKRAEPVSVEDTFTWAAEDVSRTSWIDYALVGASLERDMCKFSICKDGPWISDHLPIFLSYQCDLCGDYQPHHVRSSVGDNVIRKPDWAHSSVRQLSCYAQNLSWELDGLPYEIAEAAICNEVHSCNHTNCIRVYYNRLTDTMKLAAKLSLPRTKGVSICRPGWNLTLKQSKAIAQNAYQRWKREGKPRHGMYYRVMCESRNDFKREMRKWKRDKELVLGRKLAEDLKDGNQDCFWRKLRRGCGDQGQDVCSSRIGVAHTNCDILKLWKDHFGKVANCHSQTERTRLQEIFMDDLKTFERTDGQKMWDSTVSLGVVKKAASRLRNRKAVGLDEISAEHIKHGGTGLLIHISIVFQAMLRHGYVPEQWKESVIVPILKIKTGSKIDPDNYRGITLSSVMSKLFERVLLIKYGHLLKTSQLQFGFTPNVGTAECSYVIQETIDHYLSNGNDLMYTCALDLSKASARNALDRVSHHRLMSLLVKRQVPVQVVKMIYDDGTLTRSNCQSTMGWCNIRGIWCVKWGKTRGRFVSHFL